MKIGINSSWLILGIALAVGGLAAFGVHRYIQRQVDDIEARDKGRKVRVVVPKEDLPKGATITAQRMAVREIPSEYAHSNAITPDQFPRVENQTLAYPAAHGEMLLWSLLEGQRAPSFSSRLVPGHRAITVPVDEINSISGMLEPGDRIDLVVSVKKDARTFMFPLLQNVGVMATGQRAAVAPDAAGGESKRAFTSITLDASPEEAERVLAAREVGKISALLRPPGDTAMASIARQDSMALLGLGSDAALRADGPGVPVLYGHGGPSGSARPAVAATPRKLAVDPSVAP